MTAGSRRTLVALALQGGALLALAGALLGVSWLDGRSRPRLLLLVDRSQSMPSAAVDQSVADAARAARAAGSGEVRVLEFAGRPAQRSRQSTPVADAVADLDPSQTNIEAALDAALAAHAQSAYAGLVVVSDGLANVGDTERGLRAVRDAQLPLQWIAVGRPPPDTRITDLLAPARAQLGQRIELTVQLAGRLDRPLLISARARGPGGDAQVVSAAADAQGRATLGVDAARSGALMLDLTLHDPASEATLASWPDAAVVDVVPRAALLYAQGSGGTLAHSLRRGGWALDVVPAARIDALADSLDGYRAVVLDDVAIADAGPRFWRSLAAAVQQRGVGLMVLGGERSFARGGYRGSELESLLPVTAEPAALDEPASIVFAVDKSGSMGQGSGGVDRFSLAQRAVQETAAGLGERDSLGLLVFDAQPRLLIPLMPASAANQVLARDWQTSPNGGTRLVPAIEAALDQLEHSTAARRMLVVVTDGFVDEAPLAGLRARLARSGVEIIALAVGPDADLRALERVIGTTSGQVLRVDQAAELPLVMRSGLERRRARVERGRIAVRQTQDLPFAPARLTDWPPIAAHAVTRPRAQATVAVQSQRGDALIAWQRAGRGRVVVVTSGLGPWTPQWLQWPAWPQLAGGLADWAGGQGGAPALAVSDRPTGMRVEIDLPAGSGRTDADGLSIAVNSPTSQGAAVSAELVAPRRLQATLPDAGPGLYTFVATGAHGTQRQLHLRRHRAEHESWGINPALLAWRSAGLIGTGEPGAPAGAGPGRPEQRPVDRSLLALGLVLFLAGVLVDRTRWTPAGWRTALRRWRRPA